MANESYPIIETIPQTDLNGLRYHLGNVSKMEDNDDIYVVFNENFLVVFYILRAVAENVQISVFNIDNEPKLLYKINKGINFVTDKLIIHKDHVIIAPSWPVLADAVIMVLSIKDQMTIVGKFMFEDQAKKNAINQVNFL